MEERVKSNYDHPNAMDHSLLFQHLQALKRVRRLNYRYTSCVEHTRMQENLVRAGTEEGDYFSCNFADRRAFA